MNPDGPILFIYADFLILEQAFQKWKLSFYHERAFKVARDTSRFQVMRLSCALLFSGEIAFSGAGLRDKMQD